MSRIVKSADVEPLRRVKIQRVIEDFERAYKPENIMTYGLPTEEMRRYGTLTRNEIAACEMIVQAEKQFKNEKYWLRIRETRLEELVDKMLEIAKEQHEGDIYLVSVRDAIDVLKEQSKSEKEESEQGGTTH